MSNIVRAIDVGLWGVKFVMNNGGHNMDIGCDSFPTLSPIASKSNLELGGVLNKKNTVVIEVNGKSYEIGYDVESVVGSNYGRTMDSTFYLSDSYMALVNGALFYMGVSKVDLLVLGLPVSCHQTLKDQLENNMVGEHKLPGKTIEVGKCKVLAQPVGGFFEYGSRKQNLDKFKKETNLIVDVGFYTLDWFVSDGMTPSHARCGAANNGGMGSVVSSIANVISDELDKPVDQNMFSRIDKALRSVDKRIKVYSKEFDIGNYIQVGKAAALESINKMCMQVGDGSDIDNILIVGGGGWFYKDLVEAKFPLHTVMSSDESSFSNVRGFQLYGLEMMRQAELSKNSKKVA